MRKYFFLFLLMSSSICFGQDRKVELEIIGTKKYDNLYLRANQLNNNPVKFAGETANGSQWTFTIPDSIVKKTLYFDFRGETPTECYIDFLSVIQEDTLKGFYIHFDNDELLIRLKMEYHHTFREKSTDYIPALEKTITIKEYDVDLYFIDSNQNRFLKENMMDLSFGFFRNNKGEDYDVILAGYASKIKDNPNSLYYTNRLAMASNYYRSKEDIAWLYSLFSDEMQHSYFGQIVYNNFSTFKINDVWLTNCDTKMEETMVTDPSKHTLLIFSASWCAPCHKKIPILKRIYEEKNMALNMVYVTIDDEKTLPQWRELMRKENIPWRSLSLNGNKGKAWQNVWNVGAVPDYILINQNWETRKINLNDENDINSLYLIIQNN